MHRVNFDHSLLLAAGFFDPEQLVVSGGLLLIAAIIFAECGLLFGVIFPGDTLLVAVGILAAQGQFPVALAISIITVSAFLGGQAGYWIGNKSGPRLFRKDDGIIFRKEYIQKSEDFYERHGGKTIALARFVPVVRTFAPVVAGIGNMNPTKFVLYNALGSILWSTSITLFAYYLGSRIPFIVNNIEYVFILAIPFILGPPLYHLFGTRESRARIAKKLRS
jgi:membrane-associated protein